MSERIALLELHDWDELLFGGFYCLHCTPDDEDSLDEPIAWPCPPLRQAGVTDDEARALIEAHREKAAAEYQAKKAAEQAELQRRVDEFNARYSVGTPVLAFPGCRPEDDRNATRLVTRTRSKATVLSGHTDVVWVDGHSACIALSHVDPVTEEQFVEARAEETAAAVADVGALPVPVGTAHLTAEQRAAIAELIGNAKPATGPLVEQLAESVRDRREHEHPTWEDLFCLNLVSWAGERMGPVLRRLLDAEARVAELETDLEAKAQDAEAAVKGWERARDRVTELEVAAIEGRAALAALCHDLDGPGSMALGALYLLQQATPGTPMEPGETVPKAYRASHDSIVMGQYLTPAAAREHCEAEERRAWPTGTTLAFDWIEDEDDGVAELVVTAGQNEESTTGYVVEALDVAHAFDPDADE